MEYMIRIKIHIVVESFGCYGKKSITHTQKRKKKEEKLKFKIPSGWVWNWIKCYFDQREEWPYQVEHNVLAVLSFVTQEPSSQLMLETNPQSLRAMEFQKWAQEITQLNSLCYAPDRYSALQMSKQDYTLV